MSARSTPQLSLVMDHVRTLGNQESSDARLLVDGRHLFMSSECLRLCSAFLESEVSASPPERPIYLLGESFGGVLALAVAAGRQDLVDRIVLVNPATSFPRSVWPRLGPLLPQLPKVQPNSLPLQLDIRNPPIISSNNR